MELLKEQQKSKTLEASLTQPSNEARWRQLGGEDASMDDLVRKIEDVEVCGSVCPEADIAATARS
jgi:hypothetical protein